MPIAASDIQYRLSGGASNSNPASSLGGAKSSNEVTEATLFHNLDSAEAGAGHTDYRCVYVHNNHATLTLQAAKIWIQANTPNADSAVSIALAGEGVNGTAETVANETTAPVGESFVAAANEAAALSIGNIPPGQHQAVWIRRVSNADASAYTGDTFTLRCKGDTAA